MSEKAVSFMDPEVQMCPFSAYEKVRREGQVYIDPKTGWFIVTDYDLVRKLSADTDNLSSFTGILMCKNKSEVQEKIDDIYRNEGYMPVPALVVVDPPHHQFHRTFVDKAFTAGRVKQMENYLESIVGEMIDRVI